MHSQRMASIVPIVIGCIDYLAYGTIFPRAMFRPKIKLDVFFCQKRGRWALGGGAESFDGIVNNKLPGKLFYYLIHEKFLCNRGCIDKTIIKQIVQN
jgi:hypothetical protein